MSEESNLMILFEKMLNCIGGESISVDKVNMGEHDHIKSVVLNFENREHRLILEVGDKWRRVNKLLNILPVRVITCPSCLEDVHYDHNKHVVGCPECNVIVCADCSIKQCIANQGIVVCCNCRYTVGTHIPTYLIHESAALLRLQYNI